MNLQKFIERLKKFKFFKKSYSLILLPEDDGKSFTLRLPQKFLNFAANIILVVIFAFLVWLSFNQYDLYKKEESIEDLQSENSGLKEVNKVIFPKMRQYKNQAEALSLGIYSERQEYTEKLNILIERMQEIEKYCTELRIVAGFKLPIQEVKNLNKNWQKPQWRNAVVVDAEADSVELMDLENFVDETIKEKKWEILSLKSLLSIRETLLNDTPNSCPLQDHYVVRSDFGIRGLGFHSGIDFPAGRGTPIYAPADGVIIFQGYGVRYGRYLILRHSGDCTTRYAHLSKFAVSLGDAVERGDLIGYVGNSGRSTGNHLHYEVRKNGQALDPKKFISEKLTISELSN